jgi:ABC-type dipeptide/oligopeptide/nickel transport system ATPase component
MPDPANPPPGCAFHTRCPKIFEPCTTERPELRRRDGMVLGEVACHLYV